MARSFKSWAAQNDDELRREEEDQEEEQSRPKSFKAWKQQSTTPDTPAAVPTATPSIPAPSTSAQRTGFKAWRQQNGTPIPEATAAEPKYSTMDRYRPGGVYRPEVAELHPEPETYAGTTSSIGRYRPSGMYKPETQEVQGAQPWDALYSSGAIARGQELAAKSTLSGEEKQEARALQREIDKVTKTRGTAKSDKYAELTDLSAKLYSKSNWFAGLSSGVIQALGFDWLTDRTADIVEAVTGVKSDTGAQELTASAQKNFPIWNAAGNVAGSVLELGAISSAVGGALSKAKWFANLSPWVKRATSSAITFGLSGAANGVTEIQTKEEWDKQEREQADLAASFGAEYTPREYNLGNQLAKVGIGAATGAAAGALGGVASEGISLLGGSFLTAHKLTQNKLARAVVAGLSGAGFAGGSTAVRELERYLEYPEGYHPDGKQIVEDLLVAFAFSSLSYLVSAGPGAQQANPQTKYSSEYFNENMTKEEASRVYRDLAKRYHPDLHPGDPVAEAIMKQVNADYELLQTIMAPVWARDSITNAEKSYRTATTTSGETANAAAAEYASEIKYLQGAVMDGALPGTNAVDAVQILGSVLPENQAPVQPSEPEWYTALQNTPRPMDQPVQQRPTLTLPTNPPAPAATPAQAAQQAEIQAPILPAPKPVTKQATAPTGEAPAPPAPVRSEELTPEPERGIVEEKPAETPALPEGTTDADIAEMNGVSKPLWNYTRRSSSPVYGTDFKTKKNYMGDGKAIVEVDSKAESVAMADKRLGGVGARSQDMTNVMEKAKKAAASGSPLTEQPKVWKTTDGERYVFPSGTDGTVLTVGKGAARLIDNGNLLLYIDNGSKIDLLVSVNDDGSIHGVAPVIGVRMRPELYDSLPTGRLNGVKPVSKEETITDTAPEPKPTVALPTAEETLTAAPERGNLLETANGGMQNGQQAQTAGGKSHGADVSDRDGGRIPGERAGAQAGKLAGRGWQALPQPQKAAGRNARAKDLQLQKVEARSLGINSATADSRVTEYPQSEWEPDLRRIADLVQKATGKPVRFILGNLRIDAGGKELPVRGVNTGREIFVQADALGVSAEKIATHEAYHTFSRQDRGLNGRMLGRIREAFPEDDLRGLAELYLEKEQGIVDLNTTDPAELERALDYVQEEICADAYAGINAFQGGADRYTEIARAVVNESRQNRQTAEATERRTGPPEERGSAADADAEYMAAVEAGDMDTAQRMVDEAAKQAGYTIKAYHGTTDDFTKFSRGEQGRNHDGYLEFGGGFYFTPNENEAREWVRRGRSGLSGKAEPKVMSVYLSPRNIINADEPIPRGAEALQRMGMSKADANFIAGRTYRFINYLAEDKGFSNTEIQDELKSLGYDAIDATYRNAASGQYVVFDPDQIKSADPVTYDDNGEIIPLYERFNPENQDIRYSVAEEEESVPESSAEYAQRKRAGKETAPKIKKPVAKSKATRAKADLRSNLLGAFSIPAGSRAEMGTMIDAVADQIIRDGKITEEDYRRLFDALYEAGREFVPAEDYLQDIRQLMSKGRIYVPEKVKHEWGDDWNEIRKQAWANGIYLTNNEGDAGIDQWWQTLSETYPGLFPEDEYDPRTMLDRMVQLAEEGKGEYKSLEEYAADLEGMGYISEDDMTINLERQLDWALRTFGEKAKLEIDLRDRTGIKIAQERQRGAELREQAVQRERERGDKRVQAEKEHGRELLSNEKAREALRRGKERERRQETARRLRERKNLQELQQKTLKQLQWMNRNQGKFPQEMQARVKDLLEDMDILAVGAADEMHIDRATGKTWKDLRDIYLEAKEKDPNWLPSKELDNIVMRLDARKIEDLDMGALQDLYKAAVGLRTELYNRNNVIEDELHRTMQEVYDNSKSEIQAAPGGYKPGARQQYWDNWQLTPMNRMEMMAGWNPNSAWYSMARGLESGERAQRRFKERSAAYLDDFLRDNAKWAARADGQGKDAIWYELEVPELLEYHMGDKPIFGNTVKVYMTPAQKVELYLESKGYDNLRHMTGGRTFADRELYSQGKRREAYAQGKTIRLAPESVKQIVSDLTPEEQELARILEDYYNHYSKREINRVSNALYGYDKAMEGYYAPIYTNGNYNKSDPGIFDLTAEGVGNLKGRIRGVNPTLNISAFDAFEKSVDRTSRFVGLAIPVRNMNNLMNWRDKSTSMKDVLSHKWGETGEKFVEDLMTELQNGKEGSQDPMEGLVNTILSRYISSVFGFNPSIVLKQFASYPLAATYLGWENMPKWVPGAAQVDTDLLSKYSAELAYRLRGYATPETATVKDNPGVFQRKGPLNFLFGGGAITWMDGFTVRTLWTWAENKVSREQPDLELGTDEQVQNGESPFYKAVAKEFEEAVNRSQPMYDTMHRSEIMRKGGLATRTLTLFKTVPQQELNMLRQTMGEAAYYKRIGADKQTQAEARRKAGRALTGILTGNLMIGVITFLNAMVKNGAKAFRNDDGELTPESVMEQIGKQYFKDAAGLTVGGDVAADILAARLFGDKWYGLETPGIEQIEGLIDKLGKTADTMGKMVTDSINLANNGGDWGRYMAENGNTYVKAVEEAGRLIGTYATGLPLDNVKAYLLGAASGISPAIKTAYEDLMSKADKSGLKGLTGAPLEMRVQHILDDRAGGAEEQTTETIAGLYEAGYTGAVPPAVSDSYSVGGESRSMNATEKQIYSGTWRSTVEGILDDLVGNRDFRAAGEADQEKMLKWLYDIAAQEAKAAVWEDYTPEKAVQTAREMERLGVPLEDWLPIRAELAGFSGSEKKEKTAAYIDGLPYSAAQKDAIYLAAGYKETTLDDAPWHKKAGGGSGKGKTYAPTNLSGLRLPVAEREKRETVPTLTLPTAERREREEAPTLKLPTA